MNIAAGNTPKSLRAKLASSAAQKASAPDERDVRVPEPQTPYAQSAAKSMTQGGSSK